MGNSLNFCGGPQLKYFTEDDKFLIQESWNQILLKTPNLEVLVPRVLSKNASIQLPDLFENYGNFVKIFFLIRIFEKNDFLKKLKNF